MTALPAVRLKLPAVRKAMQAKPWAIQQEKLEAMLEILTVHASGGLAADELRETARAQYGDRSRPLSSKSGGGIQVLPLYGIISHRMDLMTEMSGGTSTQRFSDQFDAAMTDPSVAAIVLDVDSPGGSVDGTPELAKQIYDARGKGKRIVAVVDTLDASAAYWISSAADEIVTTPSGIVGSIGVFMVHLDESGMDEQLGLKYTLISAGKHKVDGNQYEPLSDDARAALQEQVDEYYGMFTAAVAKHRGVSASRIQNGYGQGRVLTAAQALAAGMVDRIETLEETLTRLGARNISPSGRPRQASAAAATQAFDEANRVNGRNLATPFVADTPGGEPKMPHQYTEEVQPPDPDDGDPSDDEDTPDACPMCGAEMDGDECSSDSCDYETPVIPGDGDISSRVETPSDSLPVLSPASAAKEHTVSHSTAAPGNGAGQDLNALIVAERKRAAEIRALGRDHSIDAAIVEGQIESGASVPQASLAFLSEVKSRRAKSPIIHVGAERETERPFATFGDQLIAVARAERQMAAGTPIDPRLHPLAAASGMSETIPSDGGFLVQVDFSQEIIKRAYQLGEVLSRCRKAGVGPQSNGLKINAIDETSRATGSRYGGVQVLWAFEADQATGKKPKLRQMEIALQKLIGSWFLTDELVQDATALSSVATDAFAEEVTFVTEDAIINGNGTGLPFGILNAAAKVQVSKESGQASTTFVTANAAKMFGRLWARSLGNAVWFINQDVWQQLLQLTLGSNAWPVFIPPGGVSSAPYGTLYGRPIVPIEYCATLGTAGDVIFADMSQYLVIDKGGPQQATSMHVKFLTDEMAFRITYRVGGQPLWHAALTPKNGSNTMSPFITLQGR